MISFGALFRLSGFVWQWVNVQFIWATCSTIHLNRIALFDRCAVSWRTVVGQYVIVGYIHESNKNQFVLCKTSVLDAMRHEPRVTWTNKAIFHFIAFERLIEFIRRSGSLRRPFSSIALSRVVWTKQVSRGFLEEKQTQRNYIVSERTRAP